MNDFNVQQFRNCYLERIYLYKKIEFVIFIYQDENNFAQVV
jgi:hypothetical protein